MFIGCIIIFLNRTPTLFRCEPKLKLQRKRKPRESKKGEMFDANHSIAISPLRGLKHF